MIQAAPSSIPLEVSEFCVQHGIMSHLETAIRLAKLHFAPYRELRVGVESDPEVDDAAVVIDVTLEMEVNEVLQRKQDYTRDLVASTPPNAREKFRLLYDIV